MIVAYLIGLAVMLALWLYDGPVPRGKRLLMALVTILWPITLFAAVVTIGALCWRIDDEHE